MSFKLKADSLQQKLTMQLLQQKKVEEERNEAVISLAKTMDELEQLKNTNAQLREELAQRKKQIQKKDQRSAKQRVRHQVNRSRVSNKVSLADTEDDDITVSEYSEVCLLICRNQRVI